MVSILPASQVEEEARWRRRPGDLLLKSTPYRDSVRISNWWGWSKLVVN
jgi:hypothetical protein